MIKISNFDTGFTPKPRVRILCTLTYYPTPNTWEMKWLERTKLLINIYRATSHHLAIISKNSFKNSEILQKYWRYDRRL